MYRLWRPSLSYGCSSSSSNERVSEQKKSENEKKAERETRRRRKNKTENVLNFVPEIEQPFLYFLVLTHSHTVKSTCERRESNAHANRL